MRFVVSTNNEETKNFRHFILKNGNIHQRVSLDFILVTVEH